MSAVAIRGGIGKVFGEFGTIYLNDIDTIIRNTSGEIILSDTVRNMSIEKIDSSWREMTLNLVHSKVSINRFFQFRNIKLINKAVLTHDPINTARDSGLQLIVDTLMVDSTSLIDVSSKGYHGGNSTNCALTKGFKCGATGTSGGSYGGDGGEINGTTNTLYDTPDMVTEFGSGGASPYLDTTHFGGSGGGKISITASVIIINGMIRNNGANSDSGGAGSGGSVRLYSDVINGNGVISANGGFSINGGGGGGGRIAILGTEVFGMNLKSIHSYGGAGLSRGEAGTVYIGVLDTSIVENIDYPDSLFVIVDDSLELNNDESFADKKLFVTGSKVSMSGTCHFRSLLIDNSYVEINGSVWCDSIFSVLNRSTVTHHQSIDTVNIYRCEVYAGSKIYIENQSEFNGDGKGMVGSWRADSTCFKPIPQKESSDQIYGFYDFGGSHTSQGGGRYNPRDASYSGVITPDGYFAKTQYDDIRNPNLPGSGGGSDAFGGGVFHLGAPLIEVDGVITVNGTSYPVEWGDVPGSAGGSILLNADSIIVRGVLSATGSDATGYYADGGGAGGAIAIHAKHYSLLDTGKINLHGGNKSNFESWGYGNGTCITGANNGGGGTLFYKKGNQAVLTVAPGDTNTFARLIGSNDSLDSITTIVLDGSKLEIDAPVTFKSIYLRNHATLSHPVSTCNSESALRISVVDTLFIDSTSSIDVSGKGYPGGRVELYPDYNKISYWTKDNAEIAYNFAAGSHGGMGSGYEPVGIYDSPLLPEYPGSGSGAFSLYGTLLGGGFGGGVVHINGKTVIVDGAICADGKGGVVDAHRNYSTCQPIIPPDLNGTGGAGGSILIEADTLLSTGLITANGVRAAIGESSGGGRVALYAPVLNINSSHVQAFSFPTTNAYFDSSEYLRRSSQSLPLRWLEKSTGGAGSIVISNEYYTSSGEYEIEFKGYDSPDNNPRGRAPSLVIDSTNKDFYFGHKLIFLNANCLIRGDIVIPDDWVITMKNGLIAFEGQITAKSENFLLDENSSFEFNSGDIPFDTLSIDAKTIFVRAVDCTLQVNKLEMKNGSRLIMSSGVIEADEISIDSSSMIIGQIEINKDNLTSNNVSYSIGSNESIHYGNAHGGAGELIESKEGFEPNQNIQYDNVYYPEYSAGSRIYKSGGSVRIICKRLHLDGGIIADAEVPNILSPLSENSCWAFGLGAGGSIWIDADSIVGKGFISANGTTDDKYMYGDNCDNGNLISFGGGGRVAVYADSNYEFNSDNIRVWGCNHSGAGTILIKRPEDEHGILIVDNGGKSAPDSSTVLPSIGLKYANEVQDGQLIDYDASFQSVRIVKESHNYQDTIYGNTNTFVKIDTIPVLKNHRIVFTTNPSNTDYAFRILNHDSITLSVDTTEHKLTEFTSNGGMYIGVYYFDSVFVRGGAKLYTEDIIKCDHIMIENGSMFSDYHEQHGSLQPIPSNIKLAKASTNADRKDMLNISVKGQGFSKRSNIEYSIKRLMEKMKLFFNFNTESRQAFNADIIDPAAEEITSEEETIVEVTTMTNDNEVTDNSSITCKNGDPIYEYDIIGRIVSMTSPAGKTQYHYDTITGLLDRIKSPEGKEFSYNYNHGQLSSLDYPNGISAHYVFDDNGNLADLDYRNGGGTSVKRYQYGYHKNGMRDTMIDNDGVHAYTYDPLYQIIEATSPKVQRPLEQFAYDSVGNWMGGGRIHNELNQLTEDDSCTYAYDTDGNMTGKVSKATGDTTRFTWDIESKLTEVRKPGMVVRYVYDALGRRVSKDVNGVVTQFRYDGEDLILEMNAADSITANYTFGPGMDNPMQMHRDGKNLYYVKDGLGSVTALTDSLGNIVHEYSYSVFGEIIDESGDVVKNPFTYTAREWEPEVNLYYYRARFYDAAIGRFISEDPIGFAGYDCNLYRYVFNSSVNYNDPEGKFIFNGVTAGIGATIGGISAGVNAYYMGARGWRLAGAIGLGAAGGAASGFMLNFAGSIAVGAVAGGVTNIGTQMIADDCNDDVNWESAIVSMLSGAAGGGVTKLLSHIPTDPKIAGDITSLAAGAMTTLGSEMYFQYQAWKRNVNRRYWEYQHGVGH